MAEKEKRVLIRRPKEEKKEKNTQWFIEPLGSHTNQVIARRLSELNEIADNMQIEINDVNGEPHSVYKVESHKQVLELYKSQDDFQLKFNVYTRRTIDGPITQSVIDTKEFKRSKQTKKNVKKVGMVTK
ncbi:MAG: hypothetical protein WC467_03900 [Patescibacteria group bacterium]